MKIYGGVIRTVAQVHRRRVVHETEMTPHAPVEVAARILEVSAEVAVAVVGLLKNPGMEIHAGAGVRAARFDGQIAFHRASKLVGGPDARTGHEEERAVHGRGLAAQAADVLKGADGEVVADPSLDLEQAQARRYRHAGGQAHADARQ